MWDELKPFLSTIADVIMVIIGKLWVALKWIGVLLGSIAVWFWHKLVLFFLILSDLIVNHYDALLVVAPVLIVGFLIVNKLQKKK